MAEATQFDHDQLGHLLADHLLEVPRFQRSYSWDEGNIEEYLSDLEQARGKEVSYFMGTVVFARPDGDSGRRQIVDGQQRLATTAILLAAIRDQLSDYGKRKQAEAIDERFLRGYVLSADDEVERLILSSRDQPAYDSILERRLDDLDAANALRICYEACRSYLRKVAPTSADYKNLIAVSTQLETQVQVLVAVASDLPEAYVIFETLNDRGADLTTADLLKNYLFSASRDYFHFVEDNWVLLESNFERVDDLVKFIRYEYVSRRGPVSSRKLYRAIQGELGGSAAAVKQYIKSLTAAQQIYLALREPESPYRGDINVEVRDALYAFRRFGFEASIPLLLAVFQRWDKVKAAKLLVKLANWSVRAQFAGRLGGGVAEEAFGDAASKVTSGVARNQTQVRHLLSRLIPSDSEFIAAFASYGDVSVSRAKYLLAMLEKADDESNGRPVRALEWYSRSVTIEHLLPLSESHGSEENAAVVNQIGNLALLEKRLNHQAGGKPFNEKRGIYKTSDYALTRKVAIKRTWRTESIRQRNAALGELAVHAWPSL